MSKEYREKLAFPIFIRCPNPFYITLNVKYSIVFVPLIEFPLKMKRMSYM
jgi:hypothetical protein